MSPKETARRYAGLGAGLFFSALGIALITNSHLGTTPITSLPYVVNAAFPLSMGVFVFLSNLLFIGLQKALLRSAFKPRHLLQLPVVFVFSVFVDVGMLITRPLISAHYRLQLLMCVGGSALLGLGVWIAVVCNVAVLPGDGAVIAIACVSKKIFSRVKVLFDLSLVGIACLVSLLSLNGIEGVREGTLLSALLVGPCVRFFSRWSGRLETLLGDPPKPRSQGETP